MKQSNDRKGPASRDEGKDNSRDKPMVDKDKMQERLGLGLKNMYRSVLEEPLPDDMLALLDQLDDEDEPDSSGSKSDD